MKRYLFYIIVLLCIAGCNDALDVQQVYKYTIETMPVPSAIAKNETVEIRFQINREGEYKETKYYIRYFQPLGKGILKMADGTIFTPNDRFPLENEIFRLYYTSTSTDQQTIDIYIEDNFGQVEKVLFSFTNANEK